MACLIEGVVGLEVEVSGLVDEMEFLDKFVDGELVA